MLLKWAVHFLARNICNDCVNIWLNINIPYVYYTWVTRIYIKYFSFVQQFITYNTGLKLHIKCNSPENWNYMIPQIRLYLMMASSNGNIFRVTGLLCGEFTSHRWISRTKASDAELWCFFLSVPEPTVGPTREAPVIWDTIALIMTSL